MLPTFIIDGAFREGVWHVWISIFAGGICGRVLLEDWRFDIRRFIPKLFIRISIMVFILLSFQFVRLFDNMIVWNSPSILIVCLLER
jgi:hypothetical protein